MTHPSFQTRALPLVFGALTASSVLATSPAFAASTTKSVTYKGPAVDMRWGTVQVSIVVKNRAIANVKSSVSIHTDRSQFINNQALPMLKQEVLQAQNANINVVSGATDTSGAYISSLQSAVNKARKAKTLK